MNCLCQSQQPSPQMLSKKNIIANIVWIVLVVVAWVRPPHTVLASMISSHQIVIVVALALPSWVTDGVQEVAAFRVCKFAPNEVTPPCRSVPLSVRCL